MNELSTFNIIISFIWLALIILLSLIKGTFFKTKCKVFNGIYNIALLTTGSLFTIFILSFHINFGD